MDFEKAAACEKYFLLLIVNDLTKSALRGDVDGVNCAILVLTKVFYISSELVEDLLEEIKSLSSWKSNKKKWKRISELKLRILHIDECQKEDKMNHKKKSKSWMTWIPFLIGLIFIVLLITTSTGCDKQQKRVTKISPFTTEEWKQCFDDCTSSLPKNLINLEFSDSEVKKMDVNTLCVNFCTTSLRKKREAVE